MTNYEINKQKIIDDYYLCLGAFQNCNELYKKRENFEILKDDTPSQIGIKKGRKADLLSNLGKVGEKAFKYIIGLENLRTYPNQDPNNLEMIWRKTNTLKDFAKKHGIDENNPAFIELKNYYDENNQKSHNFAYFFSVMNIIMKDISKKFEQYMIYTIQSDMLIDYCDKYDRYWYSYHNEFIDGQELSLPFRAAIFPNILDLEYENIPTIPDIQMQQLINTKNAAIEKNGDIFTRLRYASNNPNKLEFDIDEVYEIIKNIVVFIKMIHESNDKLDFDLIKFFGKYKSLEYSEELKIDQQEIENLFSLDLDGNELAVTIYEPNYSYVSIKKLLDIGIPKEDIRKVMREGLHARSIIYYNNLGIYDYGEMRKLIDYYNENGNYPNEISYKKRF